MWLLWGNGGMVLEGSRRRSRWRWMYAGKTKRVLECAATMGDYSGVRSRCYQIPVYHSATMVSQQGWEGVLEIQHTNLKYYQMSGDLFVQCFCFIWCEAAGQKKKKICIRQCLISTRQRQTICYFVFVFSFKSVLNFTLNKPWQQGAVWGNNFVVIANRKCDRSNS